MLKIKLSPIGKKGHIHYRVSVMEEKSKLTGSALEVLGHFHPHEKQFTIDSERLKYWINLGAQVTPKVKKLCKIS